MYSGGFEGCVGKFCVHIWRMLILMSDAYGDIPFYLHIFEFLEIGRVWSVASL